MQAALIEQFGRIGADVRMKAPCLREEETAVSRNRLLMVEDVVQRRNACPFGVATQHRLVELLRIAVR